MKRPKTSRAWWLDRHVHDPYVKLAQKEGYRSRAAYKLLWLDEKDHLLKQGMTVVDLGAAPGGWCQVAIKKVGERGRVIGIDLLPVQAIPGVTLFEADFTSDEGLALVEEALEGRKIDLVLSDMAPNLSGVKDADQAKHYGLAELALDFAVQWLKPDGAFVVKVFQGAGFEEFVRQARQAFRQVHVRKPEASRDESRENFLVGKGLKV
ncbi:RlmE family RNA methyltransferase [Betaproteobacteria bacterium SCN2]|jgi:23S rRNA (uridine2552-2'-O)-methyltransferase|nr:RlmE family RNA methyltransferase [Betaproteobacteria bacterium SCN2]